MLGAISIEARRRVGCEVDQEFGVAFGALNGGANETQHGEI